MTLPPCLVTFPRCLIAKTCASRRCTLISLKCLITGAIAVQHVEKHYIAVEVNAIQFFPILFYSLPEDLLYLYFTTTWSLASLCCSFSNHFFRLLGFVVFLSNKSHTSFRRTSPSTCTPQAILMSSCEDETSPWWSFVVTSHL